MNNSLIASKVFSPALSQINTIKVYFCLSSDMSAYHCLGEYCLAVGTEYIALTEGLHTVSACPVVGH
jgi:hypothetical protein